MLNGVKTGEVAFAMTSNVTGLNRTTEDEFVCPSKTTATTTPSFSRIAALERAFMTPVVTNIDAEHLEYYGTVDRIKRAFETGRQQNTKL